MTELFMIGCDHRRISPSRLAEWSGSVAGGLGDAGGPEADAAGSGSGSAAGAGTGAGAGSGSRATRIAQLLAAKAEGHLAGAVFLSTCNRVELLVDGADAAAARALFLTGSAVPAGMPESGVPESGLPERREDGVVVDVSGIEIPVVEASGRDAVERLLRIATGLESMVLGESQILGQVTRAFKASEDVGLLSKPLHMLRTRIASTARRLRAELPATRPVGSVAALGVDALLGAGPRIGILGAGETAQLALEILQRRKRAVHAVVINRTLARAESLAAHFGCQAMSLADFLASKNRAGESEGADGLELDGLELDGLLCAVDSPRPFVRRQHVEGMDIVVDLSRPSVCHRELADVEGVEFVDLDVLAQRSSASSAAQDSAAATMSMHVKARVDTIWEQLSPGRSSLAGVVELHLESALAEAEQAFRGKLADLDDDHRDLVRDLVRRVAKRDAHFHLSDLKQLGNGGDGRGAKPESAKPESAKPESAKPVPAKPAPTKPAPSNPVDAAGRVDPDEQVDGDSLAAGDPGAASCRVSNVDRTPVGTSGVRR